MKVTFEGPTITDVVQQAHFFSVAFQGETPVLKPIVTTEMNGKKRPGRPPNPNSKKGLLNRVNSNEPESQKNMVGAAGIEPATNTIIQVQSPLEPASNHYKIITKESLIEQINLFMKKDNGGGVNAIRSIFEKFGISRLGELNEKRYHELHKILEDALAL